MFATPTIRYVRRAVPDAFIAAACLAGGPGAQLLETNPYLDEVYFPGRGLYSAGGLLEAISWARERRFDVGIELSFPVQWFFSLAGVNERHRFARSALWWLFPYRDGEGKDMHAAEHFLKAAAGAFPGADTGGLAYDLFITEADRKAAGVILGGLRNRFIAIHPGARCNRNKRWEIEKFIRLGRRLRSETGRSLVVIGGAEDVPLAERVREALGAGVLVAAGKATLRETAAVIERADLYIGNDSGPLHMAAATGVPLVAIFASSNPSNFAPIGEKVTVVKPEDECSPCLNFPGYNWLPWGLRLRYYNRCRAMEGLGVDPVFEACLGLLE